MGNKICEKNLIIKMAARVYVLMPLVFFNGKSVCSFHKFIKYVLAVLMTPTMAGERNGSVKATIRPPSDRLYLFQRIRKRRHWVGRCSFM